MASRGTIEGSFAGTGSSAELLVDRSVFNFSVGGGSGTVRLERSFDSGSTWFVAKEVASDFEGVVTEVETGVYYRVSCTSFSSGPINYRLGTRFI